MNTIDEKIGEPITNLQPMFWTNFKIGDTIRFDINVNNRKTGEVKDFILTDESLEYIKQYEDESNFHNMRVITPLNQ